MIDLSVIELENGRSPWQNTPPAQRIPFKRRLSEMIKQGRAGILDKGQALPKPVRLSVKEGILGLFPDDGYLMLTPKRNWHDIKMRDEWLVNYVEGQADCARAKLHQFKLSKPRR